MKKRTFLHILEFFCRLGLGVLFIYSAGAKISDPDAFAYSVSRYRVLPEFLIGFFSLTMPMLEFLAGVSMLFTKWLRESALFIAGMLAMFIVALGQALARGLEISCGCFGVPSVGGRSEILMALVRDVVLIVPAVWLMFRPNVRIEPLRRMPKGWRMICLFGVGLLFVGWFLKDMSTSGGFALRLPSGADDASESEQRGLGQGFVVSSGPIRPGEWNVDFRGVLAKAERERRPMVLLYAQEGCRYCDRLEESIAGEAFRLWREDRAPLMTFVKEKSPRYSREITNASRDFAFMIKKKFNAKRKKLGGLPLVCVYWPQNGVTNGVTFSGRRGAMGGKRDPLLVMELMSGLDRALGKRQTETRKTLKSIVSAATVRISARAEGDGGIVAMIPESGLLPEGETVKLSAYPNTGYVFRDWRHPDGSLASLVSNLVIRGGMPVGCYTARFRTVADENEDRNVGNVLTNNSSESGGSAKKTGAKED